MKRAGFCFVRYLSCFPVLRQFPEQVIPFPYGDYRQDGYRERRRMSEAERESLRQAVRDAYRDSRYRRRD